LSKFSPRNTGVKPLPNSQKPKNKPTEIIKLLSPIPARLSKKVLEKLKFFKRKGKKLLEKVKPNNKLSYAQALASKVTEILKIKEKFSNLLAKKIENIHKIINDLDKVKLRINMTTKGPLQKQIIVPIDSENKSKFIALSSEHITNLNSVLKNIKLDVLAWINMELSLLQIRWLLSWTFRLLKDM